MNLKAHGTVNPADPVVLFHRKRPDDFFDIFKFGAVPEIEPDSADDAGVILGDVIDNARQMPGIHMVFQTNGSDALSEREMKFILDQDADSFPADVVQNERFLVDQDFFDLGGIRSIGCSAIYGIIHDNLRACLYDNPHGNHRFGSK